MVRHETHTRRHRNVLTPVHETVKQDSAKNLQLSPFLKDVWIGDIDAVRASLRHHVDILAEADPRTGMNGLHLAVGRDNFEMVKVLVEAGAAFVPDAQGRMPSLITALMEVSEELADYIYEAESRALQGKGQGHV
jgi:ankyrin repeat protein